ncbi:MAG: hypothetical protein CV045_13505 [Cyanobacteria bacterium M5B4]|nr:MAG: hypothetical protein CV045_13505 [Cyanobacteria bacterium M5B4]
MNITICAYDRPNYVSGPNAWLRRIAPALRQRGVTVRVLFFLTGTHDPAQCPTLTALQQDGFACVATPFPRYTEQRVRWLLQQVQFNPPDVFVSNLMLPGFYAARWIQSAGIPTVGILHSNDAFHHGVVDGFRWALLGTDTLSLPMLLTSTIVAIVWFVSGAFYFRRMEKTFADVV